MTGEKVDCKVFMTAIRRGISFNKNNRQDEQDLQDIF